ncbi:acyl-CoA dehydrogenase family protein [Paenibacillus validus]|uniref:acyl-CoA dehydrogenase family protein n=1 Tax=Paenibacillus TaxID=44249 RepID=UPI000FD77761|nr:MULTISPECIES: acyl-CoA dehydrogenase family protein [Paenibacillus]MED4601990.1 acyl-CoA dehydrogenase family protein [Paenibacillus validus]MED4608013.1 acyl-CoA dehydrogenase family protein [Paenibacillus validus]
MAINKLKPEAHSEIEDLLARAEAIGKLAEAEAVEADKNARFSERVAQAIEEAGFHKLMRPKKYGGLQVDLGTYVDIVRTVARHSVAAGWLVYFYSMHELWVAYLPTKGSDEIFKKGGLLADVVAPIGRVEKEGDGYRLYGHWNFCSGVLWSDWVGLGALVELPDGQGPEYCLMAVPKSDFKIVENWDTIGLRASGSNGVVVDGAFVPLHRVFPAGRALATGLPAGKDYDPNDPVYRMPFMPLFLLGFLPVVLGGVDKIVSLFQERTEKRVRVFKMGAKEKEAASSQRVMAEMKIQLHALEGVVNCYVDQLNEWQQEGKIAVSDEERERLFAMRGYVARSSAELALKALLTLGGTSIFKGDPVELVVRDLIAAASHPNQLYEDSMAAYGRTMFGMPGDPVW